MLIVKAQYTAQSVTDLSARLREVCARLPRRFDRLSELALLSAAHVLGDAETETSGIYFATADGNLSGTMTYLARLKEKGGHFANPIEFPNLLMSAPAVYLSLHLGLKGAVVTFHQGEVSGYHALAAACEALEGGRVSSALVVEAEETSSWHARIHGHATTEHTTALRIVTGHAQPGDVVIRDVCLSGGSIERARLPHATETRGSLAACALGVNALKQGERTIVLAESETHGSAAILLERL